MLCGIYGILPQVALWGKGKLCLKGTTQALMTHRSLQTFHENRKKTVVSREDKRVAEMRNNKTVSMIMGCLFSSFSSISLFLSNFTIYTCKILIVSFLKRYIFCDFTHFFILTINKEFIPYVRQLCIYKYLVVNNVYA